MTETKMWEILKKRLRTECHMSRVENAVTFGIPDIHIGYKGRGLWIETKVGQTGYFVVRPSQLAWHLSRVQFDCHDAFFLVYMKNGSWHLYPANMIERNIKVVGQTTRVYTTNHFIPVYVVLTESDLIGLLPAMRTYAEYR